MEALLRSLFIVALLGVVFPLAWLILAAFATTVLYAGLHAVSDALHGWRSVICPGADRTANVQVRAAKIVACSLLAGGAPTCGHPCLSLAHG